MVVRRVVKIYFTIIVLTIGTLNSFGFLDFGSVANFVFPQGDIDFYVTNIENQQNKKILSLEEAFITGSTYFRDGQNQYLGYIQAIEINYGEYFSTLHVVNLLNNSHVYELNLPFYQRSINGSVIYDGLSVHYLNNQPIFSTIISVGTSQSNEKTGIMQFFLNGSILNTFNYDITNYPYAKLHDIYSVDLNKYLVLTTLFESEIFDTEASYILIYDSKVNTSDFLQLEKSARSLTYDPITDSIFTSTTSSTLVRQLNSKGELIRSINVNVESSEIDLINSTYLILREYIENRLNLYYTIGASIIVLLLIPLALQKLKSDRLYR